MANNIISSLGAGSGIDITSLVSSLVEVERAPLQKRIDTRQQTLETQISGYGKLTSALDELKSAMKTLGDNDLFNVRSVSVPSSSTITANKVDPGAQTGNFSVEVLGVASAHSLAMSPQADRGAALNKSGQMSIRFGEWKDATDFAVNDARDSLSIEITESDSLDSIAAKINAEKSGIQASVVKVDDNFQLTLTGPTGKANALEISVDDASLNDFAFNATSANATQTQAAKDAELKVNGLTVFRETNTITDVIEGLDFTLNKSSPGEVLSFSITADKGSAEQAVRDFISAYNTFQKTAQELTGYKRDEDNQLVRGELAGDSTARTMINQLRASIGAAVPGVQSGFTALTNIGVRTERDGSLSISESEFSQAISDNFDLVESLFAPKMSSANTAVTVSLGSYASKTVAGSYQVEITQDPSKGRLDANAITHDFANPVSADFRISVDGTTSNLITLSDNYGSAEDLRADLQSRINGDEKLKAAKVAVDVEYDTDTHRFSFVSREYGAVSNVRFTETNGDMGALGIDTTLTGTNGVDVAGTINGVEGFGAGNVLLPALNTDAYGLNLSVSPGAKDQGSFALNFSRGLAGELTNLIDGFMASSGPIGMRQENLQKALDGLDDERTKLDDRMERINTRLLSQFTAMEAIVSSLQRTGESVSGLIDQMPFTASKD